GTIVATWFALAAAETRPETRLIHLFTLMEDGTSFDTVTGGVSSGLPNLPTEHEDRLPDGPPASVLLARHRSRVAQHGGSPRPLEARPEGAPGGGDAAALPHVRDRRWTPHSHDVRDAVQRRARADHARRRGQSLSCGPHSHGYGGSRPRASAQRARR